MKRKKKDVYSVGINAHDCCDNLITLSRSSNDLYDGTIDYLFYKVLGLTPVVYEEVVEDGLTSPKDVEIYEENFSKYEEDELNETLQDQLDRVIIFIRVKALEKGIIKRFYKDTFIPEKIGYNGFFILRTLIEFYREEKNNV